MSLRCSGDGPGDHVRWSCCGCWRVRHPSGNEADKRQQRGANKRLGPRTRNLKPAEAHWAVCLQEILEPLSVLSGRDNRCQQNLHTHVRHPTHAARHVKDTPYFQASSRNFKRFTVLFKSLTRCLHLGVKDVVN